MKTSILASILSIVLLLVTMAFFSSVIAVFYCMFGAAR